MSECKFYDIDNWGPIHCYSFREETGYQYWGEVNGVIVYVKVFQKYNLKGQFLRLWQTAENLISTTYVVEFTDGGRWDPHYEHLRVIDDPKMTKLVQDIKDELARRKEAKKQRTIAKVC